MIKKSLTSNLALDPNRNQNPNVVNKIETPNIKPINPSPQNIPPNNYNSNSNNPVQSAPRPSTIINLNKNNATQNFKIISLPTTINKKTAPAQGIPNRSQVISLNPNAQNPRGIK